MILSWHSIASGQSSSQSSSQWEVIFKTTEIRIPSIVPRVQLFHWIIPTLQPLTRSQFSPGFISFCSDWSRVILQLCLQIYHVNVNIGLHPRSFGMETLKLWLVAPGESDQELCLSGRRVWPKNPWADRHTILEQTCHHQRGSPGHILLSCLKKKILRKSILINYFKWSFLPGQSLRGRTRKTVVGFTFI